MIEYVLTFSSEEKINHIEKHLNRLNHLVESLTANNTSSAHAGACAIPQPNSSLNSSVSPFNVERPDQKPYSGTNDVAPGQSSFTAHSSFAIDFARTVVGSSQLTSKGEIEILLDMLSNIRTAFNERHDSSSRLFPLVAGSTASEQYQMPPLEAVVQLLQKSQGQFRARSLFRDTDELLADERCFMYLCLSYVLQPQSLSDICLKVYFTSDYSEADFIIVNTALHCGCFESLISSSALI